VVQDLLKADSLLGVLVEELLAHLAAEETALLPAGEFEVELAVDRLVDRLILGIVVEGEGSAEEGVNDAAVAPQVTAEGVGLVEEDLGSHVAQGSEGLLGLLVGADHLGEAEVDDLGHGVLPVGRHHDVLELHVAVDDAVAVHVLEAHADLVGQLLDSLLSDLEIAPLQVVEHVLALEVLEHQVGLLVGLEEVDEGGDVGVLADLEHFNLAAQLLQLQRVHLLLLDGLDGHLLLGKLALGQPHKPELPLPQVLLEGVEVGDVVLVEVDVLVEALQPQLRQLLVLEVELAAFARGEEDLDGEEVAALGLAELGGEEADEGLHERVHEGVAGVVAAVRVHIVEVDLVAAQEHLELLELVHVHLQEALALLQALLLLDVLLEVPEALQRSAPLPLVLVRG